MTNAHLSTADDAVPANAVEPETSSRCSSEDDGGSPFPWHDEEISTEHSDDEERTSLSKAKSPSRSFTLEEEKVIIRKFDTRLVLFMALLYMLSFLDRSSQHPFFVPTFRPSSVDISDETDAFSNYHSDDPDL